MKSEHCQGLSSSLPLESEGKIETVGTRFQIAGPSFLVRSPNDGEPFGLEWSMILQVSNIIFPDENSGVRCQYYKGSDKI